MVLPQLTVNSIVYCVLFVRRSGVLGLVALLLGYYSLRAASTDGDGEGGARGEQVVRGSGAPPARAVGNTAAGPVDAGSSQAYATHTAKSQVGRREGFQLKIYKLGIS